MTANTEFCYQYHCTSGAIILHNIALDIARKGTQQFVTDYEENHINY